MNIFNYTEFKHNIYAELKTVNRRYSENKTARSPTSVLFVISFVMNIFFKYNNTM